MSLTVQNIANALFKKLQGKSSTSDARQFFEEPRDARGAVFLSQVVAQSDLIPTTAPGGADQVVTGVLKRWIDLTLTAVPGVANAFFSDNLKGCIPFNFGDGSYNYGLKDSAGNAIPFGQGDWLVDTDTGTLTFYGTSPANMPPKISFYQYVGTYGAVGANGPYLQLAQQATDPVAPPVGFQRIYLKQDGKPYTIDSTGAVKKLGGAGGGAAGKNYLADLYDGSSTTGISLFNQNQFYSFASGLVDALGDVINYTGCPYATGQAVTYGAGTTAIGGLTNNTIYYVVRIAGQANIFGLATTLDNAQAKRLIDLTSQGAGTHSFQSATTGVSSGLGLGTTGAAPGLTQTINTTLPLRLPSNLRLSKDAANRIGSGWSYPFTMDRADVDIGRPMKLAFKFRSSANFTSVAGFEDVKVELYDLDNQLVIPLDGQYLQPLPVSAVTTGFQFGFTPNVGGYNCRLIISNQNVNTNAYDLDFVDLEISSAAGQVPGTFAARMTTVSMAAVGVTSGTAPTKGTIVIDRLQAGRNADYGRLNYQFQQSAAGTQGSASDYLYTLPNNWQFDPARVTFNQEVATNAAAVWNSRNAFVAGALNDTANQATVFVVPYNATQYRLGLIWSGPNQGRGFHGGAIFHYGNTLSFSMDVALPILGFDAGALYSTSEIALKQTPTTVNSAAQSITGGWWNTFTNNSLTLQPGTYDLTSSVFFTNSGSAPQYQVVRHGWFAANGGNSTAVPASLATIPGATVFGQGPVNPYNQHSLPNLNDAYEYGQPLTLKLTQPATIYYVCEAECVAPGNARIITSITANKRPDYSAFGVYGQVDIRTVKTPLINPNATWAAFSNNVHVLPVGTWRVKVKPFFGNSAGYTNTAWKLAAANGTGSGEPAAYSTLANVVPLDDWPGPWAGGVVGTNNYGGHAYEVTFRVTSGTATVYGVAFADASTRASMQVNLIVTAERLQ